MQTLPALSQRNLGETMRSFEGDCIGGPLDKQRLAHWTKEKAFYRPMVALSMRDDAPVEAIVIGKYRLNDVGQWQWWPSL